MAQDYLIALNLADKKVLIVGGGAVAQRKVQTLLESGPQITVVSPELTPQLSQWLAEGLISCDKRNYQRRDIKDKFLVVAATDSAKVNKEVAENALAMDKLINVVDQPQLSNFNVPAVLRQGDLTISISTAAKSPALSARIKRELEARFGAEYRIFLNLLGALRKPIIEQVEKGKLRKQIFRDLASSPLPELIKAEEFKQAEELINSMLAVGIEVKYLASGEFEIIK